jgi:uncharacterized protein with FMN-binding domain
MRRVILAVTGTIAGLVALLSFKSHAPSLSAAATSGTSGASSFSSSSPAVPGEFPTGSDAANLPPDETALTGQVANTVYGPVQVQLIVRSNKIIKVAVLQQPTSTIHDIQIGQFAFPELISETLKAQSAEIDAVSGASYTSQGYIQSLQSALDHGI